MIPSVTDFISGCTFLDVLLFVLLLSNFSMGSPFICDDCNDVGEQMICRNCRRAPRTPCVPKPLSDKEKEYLCDLHNSLRNRIALGDTRLPPAANMEQIKWDVDQEGRAQRWAEECDQTLVQIPLDSTDGENFAEIERVPSMSDLDILQEVFKMWSNEILNYNASHLSTQKPFEIPTEHDNLTQLIWGDTVSMGCGRVEIGNVQRLFCNYVTRGKFSGQPVYQPGAARSACSQSALNPSFKGLCTSEISEETLSSKLSFPREFSRFYRSGMSIAHRKCTYLCSFAKASLFLFIGCLLLLTARLALYLHQTKRQPTPPTDYKILT